MIPYTLIAAVTAAVYAVGSLGLKKAMTGGASSGRVTVVSNLAMALWSLPLIVLIPGNFWGGSWVAPLAAGLFMFGGRVCLIKALQVGDLSLVAPMLATKTMLVGVFSLAADPASVSGTLLVGAVLATFGVILLNRGPAEDAGERWKAAGLAGSASILFALCDVVVQANAGDMGVGWFLPVMFLTVAGLSPLLGRTQPAPAVARPAMIGGAAIMGFQTSLMVLVIGLSGNATLINIVYSTRSLWSVVVDWLSGGRGVRTHFGSRLAGAGCLVAGVVLVILFPEGWGG